MMKLGKVEDVRFASNTSHIDNTVYEWKMTPEQLAEYKKNQKSPIGVDKMNGREVYSRKRVSISKSTTRT